MCKTQSKTNVSKKSNKQRNTKKNFTLLRGKKMPTMNCRIIRNPENHFEVSNKITEITKKEENLCMFNCMFQSLRTTELRKAFCCNDVQNPAAQFLKESSRITIKRSVHGYNSQDMNLYLRYLKNNGFISSYKFKKINWFNLQSIFKTLFEENSTLPVVQESYLLMGHTLNTEIKPKIIKTFNEKKNSLEIEHYANPETKKKSVERRLQEFYFNEEEMKTMRKKCYIRKLEHGAVIGIEKDRSIWLYDNGCFTRRPVNSILNVADRLLDFWGAYVFEISI
jgi:hypothetical protein